MNIASKFIVISKIASHLNKLNLKWAIGGSCLLVIKDIQEHFHDLDIMTTKNDFPKIDKVLSTLGKTKKTRPSNIFQSTFFKTYLVDGLKVDLMAEFKIIQDEEIHTFQYEQNQTFETFYLNDEMMYLDDLNAWLTYYNLMERFEQVNKIKDYFRKRSNITL
jgi:hypothetical protein